VGCGVGRCEYTSLLFSRSASTCVRLHAKLSGDNTGGDNGRSKLRSDFIGCDAVQDGQHVQRVGLRELRALAQPRRRTAMDRLSLVEEARLVRVVPVRMWVANRLAALAPIAPIRIQSQTKSCSRKT
jgi:hypothetical protein